MSFWKWSKTASANATADGTINWAEGMSPSAVNDSARAMMAAAAKWRDDNSGSLVTAGTSTAYTLSTNQAFDSLASMSGHSLRIRPHATNGANATLNVDGLGARSICSKVGVAMPAGAFFWPAVYDLVFDNGNNCWLVVGAAEAAALFVAPSGTRMLFQQTAAPTGWTKDLTHGDKALRVVNGPVTTGGSSNFSTVFVARTISQANLPNYTLPNTLDVAGSVSLWNGSGPPRAPYAGSPSTGAASGGGAPNYYATGVFGDITVDISGLSLSGSVTLGGSGAAMDFNVAYVDVIIATKD